MQRPVLAWAWRQRTDSSGGSILSIRLSINGASSSKSPICNFISSYDFFSCWIESVKEIMQTQTYTDKTDGPFIERKESMIVWNYRDADPEFGNWQAKELTNQLEHVFCNLPIRVVHNKKQLEVVPSQLKKVRRELGC